ncbi:MAG: NUDIX hydrolase [Chloroflexota bacterium]|nr:NUDIX hydrolase [Chloroflexota bacterium]
MLHGTNLDHALKPWRPTSGGSVTNKTPESFYAGLPRKRVGAGALITDASGRVLVVEQTYRTTCEVPGGVVEASETAPAACARECREELGIDVAVGRLLVTEHQTEDSFKGDSIMYIYDGGVVSDPGTIRIAADEIRSFRFVQPDDLHALMTAKLARRLAAALRARAGGIVVELENGVERQPPGRL